MGEENRGASGGSTALLVIGVVGAVMLVFCCGIVGLFGAGIFWTANRVQEVQTEMIKAQDEAQENFERANQEMQKANADFEKAREDIKSDIEAIKLPDSPTSPEAPAIPGSSESDDGK